MRERKAPLGARFGCHGVIAIPLVFYKCLRWPMAANIAQTGHKR